MVRMKMEVRGEDGNLRVETSHIISAWLSANLRENEARARSVALCYEDALRALASKGACSAEYESAYRTLLACVDILKRRCDEMAKEIAWKEVGR